MLVSMRIDGADRLMPAEAFTDGSLGVADQAGRDFACPTSQVRVSRPSRAYAWLAEGCGHRAAYVDVDRVVQTTALEGHPNRCVRLQTTHFVRLDGPIVPALERFDAENPGPPSAMGQAYDAHFAGSAGYVAQWAALQEAGARDLSCARADVVPGFWRDGRTTTPVAEGCGQRAVYLPGSSAPFVLASKVALPGGSGSSAAASMIAPSGTVE